jgi:hypothetical protein
MPAAEADLGRSLVALLAAVSAVVLAGYALTAATRAAVARLRELRGFERHCYDLQRLGASGRTRLLIDEARRDGDRAMARYGWAGVSRANRERLDRRSDAKGVRDDGR